MIAPGDTVADFTLTDQSGAEVTWGALRGSPAVFFFYPKASTPGCTTEACAFRDLAPEFAALGVNVFGISADSVKRQAGFATKYDLTMPLLADEQRQVIEAWGVWQEKKNYGKTYMGIVRSTVLFDADGKVAEVWSPVRVKGHADAVLARAKQLVEG
ncbi:MAG: thioredoxin-dependent thiol peroxidase [Alphaproteobacteria bacterium]|nr:thioredoxin-dependent thiol peroxidase [Alphaproteobacteria bacterium]